MGGFTNINSTIHGNQVIYNILRDDNSINDFCNQLKDVRIALEGLPATPESVSAIGSLRAAEMAAAQTDKSKVMQFLKSAGEVALDVAKDIGASVVERAIKSAIGI